jgi:hypothetical protein
MTAQPRERQMNFNTLLLSIVMGLAIWTVHSMVQAQNDIASIKAYEQGEKERTDSLAETVHNQDDRIRELEMRRPPPMRN